jgi:hypothetical protein
VLARRLTPHLSTRRTGRLYPRRNASQRALIAGVATVVLAYIWLNVDSMATRIALTILVLVASPALIVLTFDRR